MTLREVVADEVIKLLKAHSPKYVSELTGLNSLEVQNILKNDTPNLRYFTLVSAALKLGVKIENCLVDERVNSGTIV